MIKYKKMEVKILPQKDNPHQEIVQIPRNALHLSRLLHEMLAVNDDCEEEEEIPVEGVSLAIMQKIASFMVHHAENPLCKIVKPLKEFDMTSVVGEWDANFIDLPVEDVLELLNAANYLDIPDLTELGVCKIACYIHDQTPEQIREMFHIEGDITPEEEKHVRESNSWLFECGEDGGEGEGDAQDEDE